MTLVDILKNNRHPVLSFEVFPPKTDAAYTHLRQILPELVELKPDYMTVTYGAFGSTQGRTLEIAAEIQTQFGLPTASHLTCVGASRYELDVILQQIENSGIRNIVALRGDPPQGQKDFVAPVDGFGHAQDLVAHIRAREARLNLPRCGIAVAGYPEKHIEAESMDSDLRHLKAKVDAGADCIITQLFYDNRCFFEFERKAREIGIEVPIIPGLLPILSAKQVMRILSLCGSTLPEGLRAELESAGEDAARAEDIGVRHCIQQAKELIAHGVPGIHFYVLNKSAHMVRIIQGIRNSNTSQQ